VIASRIELARRSSLWLILASADIGGQRLVSHHNPLNSLIRPPLIGWLSMEASWAFEYLEHLKTSKATYQRHHLGHFLAWLRDRNVRLESLTPGLVYDYLHYRRSLGHCRGYVLSALSALRHIVGYAIGRGLMLSDPALEVRSSWLDVPGGHAYQGPLRDLFQHPAVLARYCLPLFAPDWEDYLRHLLERGYSRGHIQHVMLQHLHFHRYLVSRKVRRRTRITPELLSAFLRQGHFPSQKKPGNALSPAFVKNARGSIEGFLDFVSRRRGGPGINISPPLRFKVLSGRLMKRYVVYSRAHLGLRPRTEQLHLYWLAKLDAFLSRRKIRGIRQVSLADLDAFFVRCGKSMQARTLQRVASAARSFFRYLHLHGAISADLAQHIASPVRFRCDLWPKYLPWKKIEELLAGIDRTSPVGKRDYAILALMACHGLRNREVATFRMADIDWDQQSILLRQRKNGSTTWLPVSQRVLAALRDYIEARPVVSYPELFLTQHAPIKPLGFSAHAVAQKHLHRRFEGSLPHYGAHVLRHSFAKALLDRGAKLSEIGTLLGHQNLDSTLIYTRVATEDLRDVADNYAELLARSDQA